MLLYSVTVYLCTLSFSSSECERSTIVWIFVLTCRFAEEMSRFGDIAYNQLTSMKDWREKQREKENVSVERVCWRCVVSKSAMMTKVFENHCSEVTSTNRKFDANDLIMLTKICYFACAVCGNMSMYVSIHFPLSKDVCL